MKKPLDVAIAAVLLVLAGATLSHPWEPIGFPFQSWGEGYFIDGTNNDVEDGFYLSAYAEQGMDAVELPGGVLNFFASGSLLVGGEKDKDPWNSKFEPSAGLRWRYDFRVDPARGPLGWAGIDIGARVSRIEYLHDNIEDEVRYIGFISWSVGGDWKGRR